jgi:hypothetical protein
MQKSTFSTQLSTEMGDKTAILSGFPGVFHTWAPPAYFLSTDYGLFKSHFHPIEG